MECDLSKFSSKMLCARNGKQEILEVKRDIFVITSRAADGKKLIHRLAVDRGLCFVRFVVPEKGEYMRKYRKSYYARRRRRVFVFGGLVAILLLMIYVWFLVFSFIGHKWGYEPTTENGNQFWESGSWSDTTESEDDEKTVEGRLRAFAQANGFSVHEYPEELVALLKRNAETEEFVLQYPLKKDFFSRDALTECLRKEEVPLLMQWDSRWGYSVYGDGIMGLTGCGPTCLSMVAIHLLQDAELTPLYIADYAERNGYYVDGTGTAWTLMSEGARVLGLNVQEVSLDKNKVMKYLKQGRPIIASMGPGDFTGTGHFIVFVGAEDGKIRVNDPNSKEKSEKLWEFDDIKYQIKNMWAYK